MFIKRKTVRIVTDSRCGGLLNYLEKDSNLNSCYKFDFQCKKGATLEVLGKLIDKKPWRKWDYAIILGGICNFTERTITEDKKLLVYTRKHSRVPELKSLITELKAKHKESLNIATIPPAYLENYFKHNNQNNGILSQQEITEQEKQQKQLEEDIKEVNEKIIEINRQEQTDTINLEEKSYVSSLKNKKRKKGKPDRVLRLKKRNFPDGVHADEELRELWFRRIAGVLLKQSQKRKLESDSESETWDHKRRRVTGLKNSDRNSGSTSGQGYRPAGNYQEK